MGMVRAGRAELPAAVGAPSVVVGLVPVGLDYWIWPGWLAGLGSSLSDLSARPPGRALPGRARPQGNR
jgi:hypothetical protein